MWFCKAVGGGVGILPIYPSVGYEHYNCQSSAALRSVPVNSQSLDLPASDRVPGPVLHYVSFNHNGQLVLASAETWLLIWSPDTGHLVCTTELVVESYIYVCVWGWVCVCDCVNQGSTNDNCYTQRLVIPRAQTYRWTLIRNQKLGRSDLVQCLYNCATSWASQTNGLLVH